MRTGLGLACAVSTSLVVLGQSPSPLQRLLQAELARIPAKAGIYVKHLKTGEEAAVLPDERFNSASVIKIPVFVMGYQMAEKGALDFNARVPIAKADKRGGSGVLRYHDAGLQPTIRDVMMQMIITSDNTATDIAIARVGGVAAVNAWLQSNGYAPALKLNATILEVFRNRYTLADPRAKVAERRGRLRPGFRSTWPTARPSRRGSRPSRPACRSRRSRRRTSGASPPSRPPGSARSRRAASGRFSRRSRPASSPPPRRRAR